jgi:hypothetical protein
MYVRHHVKHPNFCQSLRKIEFSRQSLKNPQISSTIKIRPVGVELFLLEDRQMDSRHDEGDSRFP